MLCELVLKPRVVKGFEEVRREDPMRWPPVKLLGSGARAPGAVNGLSDRRLTDRAILEGPIELLSLQERELPGRDGVRPPVVIAKAAATLAMSRSALSISSSVLASTGIDRVSVRHGRTT